MLSWNFTKWELALWSGSCTLIVAAHLFWGGEGGLSLWASLIGATSLIFCAKGNPLGQVLMILFSLLYGWISLTFAYYGEMATYLGMTLPMAALSLIQWLRHPYAGQRSQVAVARLRPGEWRLMAVLTAGVTVIFFFLLRAFHTANLVPSTVSVATSFAAAYLTFRRNPWLSFWYALNDVVLVVLWVLASLEDRSYLSVVLCFLVFLVNDLYGFINWRAMERRQRAGA